MVLTGTPSGATIRQRPPTLPLVAEEGPRAETGMACSKKGHIDNLTCLLSSFNWIFTKLKLIGENKHLPTSATAIRRGLIKDRPKLQISITKIMEPSRSNKQQRAPDISATN